MMATILNSSILNSAILHSAILHKTLTQSNSIWLKLIHSDWTWWWQSSWILPSWIQTPCYLLSDSLKNTLTPLWHWFKLIQYDKLIHSQLTWWLQLSWNLSSSIQPFCTKKNFTHSFWLNLMKAAILNSVILDSAILHKKNFTHSFWLNLMMAAILNSAMLDSDTAILDSNALLSSLRFTQKHSSSTLTLTPTNSIW